MQWKDRMQLKLYSMAYPVTALGPGPRVVLWVAGCPKRCAGCMSLEMLGPEAGERVPVAKLAQKILAIAAPLDGITISGGEPFDQAASLAALVEMLRVQRPEWNVIIYSGYTL